MLSFLCSLLLCVFTMPLLARSISMKPDGFTWMDNLKKQDVREVNICGNDRISNTKKSLYRDFLLGTPGTGYLFSGLISHQRYWQILKSMNLKEAKAELEKGFSMTILWKVSDAGEVQPFGTPKIELNFTATVKDCVEGAKTTLGLDCSKFPLEQRESCCGQKFVGPQLTWAQEGKEYLLKYSPDPSLKLRVPGEKANRFCHVVDSISF